MLLTYSQSMSKQIIIHCQTSLLSKLNELDVIFFESNTFDDEYDVVVDDIEGLEDSEICNHYGIDYDQVNCIEAV